MSKTDYEQLKKDVATLKRAVDDLEVARVADTTGDKVDALTKKVDALAENVNHQMAEIRRVLVGNNGTGSLEILSGLMETVESLGRVVETLHREGQLKNDVIESLVPKLSMEKTWQSVALMWQSYAVRLSLVYDQAK